MATTATPIPTPNHRSAGPRVLAVASGGGHWVQLRRLRRAFDGARVTWVSVDPTLEREVGDDRFRSVPDATRWNRIGLVRLALRTLWIVLRERPQVVVTTGAAPGYFAVLFGRLLGARTAWIDSMANVEHLSMCGSRIGRHADLWLTQWPALARPGGPQFRGAVL